MTKIIPERFQNEDLYFFDDMESVVVRWEYKKQKAFQKFQNEKEFECKGLSFFNRVVNEGREVSAEYYQNF